MSEKNSNSFYDECEREFLSGVREFFLTDGSEEEKEALLRLKSKHGDVRIFVVDGCMVANEIK